MHIPATWKCATVGAAVTGLSFIGAGTATADGIIRNNAWIVGAAELTAATAGNDVEAGSTPGGAAHSGSYGSQSILRESTKHAPAKKMTRDWGPSQATSSDWSPSQFGR
ncbi:MAG: hypothetical protein K0U70_15485 [Actinomycetia bacterium]|nr:hypothetical protein [Actinomycetes bacterium]MCH9769188.1 hypothetical protein [Actinomycetes bacterium]